MNKYIYLKEVNSTNTYAKEHLAQFEDGNIIIAETQTQGRGRLQRFWQSENDGNLYVSIILKPEKPINKLPLANLTQYLCIVSAKVLNPYGLQSQIKWPNDILINSKKISGILCEVQTKGMKLEGIILGFGLNLNMQKNELEKINKPATSLNLELNHKIDKKELLDLIIEEFFANYQLFLDFGFELIKNDYMRMFYKPEEEVRVSLLSEIIKGKIDSITDNGELFFLKNDGAFVTISAGDIL